MSNRGTLSLFLLPVMFIVLCGCTAKNNPLTQDNITGNWQVIEVGMDLQVKQTYDVNIIQTGDVIKFYRGTIELGHGYLFNETISVTTQTGTEWQDFGVLLISVVNNTVMRAVPETTALKWVSFEKLI